MEKDLNGILLGPLQLKFLHPLMAIPGITLQI